MKAAVFGVIAGWMIIMFLDFVAVKSYPDAERTKVACHRVMESFHQKPIATTLLVGGWVCGCVDVTGFESGENK